MDQLAGTMRRSPLPENRIERIRRERYRPSVTQWDYLHLAALLSGLKKEFNHLPADAGPCLDLYCGTQPYRDIVPWQPVWGLDLDLHFGRADVVGGATLPFRSGVFSRVLCTEALHFVQDPAPLVRELYRTVVPGGYVVVTVPHLFRKELPYELRYRADQLQGLFRDWPESRVAKVGGLGIGFAYLVGKICVGAARRFRPIRKILPAVALALNALGIGLEFILYPFSWRWPAILIVVARRPPG